MERRDMTLPLLIGGATTSQQHTAVKIAPEYQPARRARARRVARGRRRLEPAERRRSGRRSIGGNRAEQAQLREQYAQPRRAADAAIRKARAEPAAARLREPHATPAFTGARQVDVDLDELVPFIDWTFFFAAWELKGRFPAILDHPSTARRRATSTITPRSC